MQKAPIVSKAGGQGAAERTRTNLVHGALHHPTATVGDDAPQYLTARLQGITIEAGEHLLAHGDHLAFDARHHGQTVRLDLQMFLPAVLCIRTATDQTELFHAVEQTHQRRRLDAQMGRKTALVVAFLGGVQRPQHPPGGLGHAPGTQAFVQFHPPQGGGAMQQGGNGSLIFGQLFH